MSGPPGNSASGRSQQGKSRGDWPYRSIPAETPRSAATLTSGMKKVRPGPPYESACQTCTRCEIMLVLILNTNHTINISIQYALVLVIVFVLLPNLRGSPKASGTRARGGDRHHPEARGRITVAGMPR